MILDDELTVVQIFTSSTHTKVTAISEYLTVTSSMVLPYLCHQLGKATNENVSSGQVSVNKVEIQVKMCHSCR